MNAGLSQEKKSRSNHASILIWTKKGTVLNYQGMSLYFIGEYEVDYGFQQYFYQEYVCGGHLRG